jgi:hypothetical protein
MCSSTVDRSSGVALSPLARRASSSPLASMKRDARPTGIAQSMCSRGDCYDNAVAESFFATLKKELIHGRSWPSKAELRTEVFEYTESSSTAVAGTPHSAFSRPSSSRRSATIII